METFAIRFKNSEIANKFKEVYDTYKQCNAESDEKSPVAPAADADADAAPAADADKKDDSTDAAPAADATDADDSDDKAAGFALWKDIFDSKNDVEVLSDEDLKEIFDTFDADKTDSIDRKELAVLIETAITSAFKKNGLDAELESITESMGEVVAALSESALKTLDDNKDGSLSWEEVKGMDIMKLIFATGE